MNIPSHYQNDLFNEVAQHYDEFEVVYAHWHDKERKTLGWQFNNSQDYRSKTLGKDLKIWRIIPYIFQHRKAVHIVNGIWAERTFFVVIVLLNLFQSSFFIYSEAPIPTKKRSLFKRMLLFFWVKPIAKVLIYRAKGFFAVSIFAVNYFQQLGVKDEKIYRFGYFLNVREGAQILSQKPMTSFIFVGQLIERKGIFILLQAIEKLAQKDYSFHLLIIGIGHLEQTVKSYLVSKQLQRFVTLLGAVPPKNIPDYMAQSDLLILPSLFDGWGIVVNEALQSGIPALVSDQCGAKELIENGQNGVIVEANNVNDLTQKLADFLTLSSQEKTTMKQQTQKTGKTLNTPIIAQYLNDCITHCLNPNRPKPSTPWLK